LRRGCLMRRTLRAPPDSRTTPNRRKSYVLIPSSHVGGGLGWRTIAVQLSNAPHSANYPHMAHDPTLPRDTARNLRANATEPEQKLWSKLRKGQLYGFQFRRQHSIGPFFADFICLEANVIVELDGSQHADQKEQDLSRSDFLRSNGYQVLRFWNCEVIGDVDSVVERIAKVLRQTVRKGAQNK
jgi:very-short-patch-repair endonuclease